MEQVAYIWAYAPNTLLVPFKYAADTKYDVANPYSQRRCQYLQHSAGTSKNAVESAEIPSSYQKKVETAWRNKKPAFSTTPGIKYPSPRARREGRSRNGLSSCLFRSVRTSKTEVAYRQTGISLPLPGLLRYG